MKREILFRGKNEHSGWHYGYLTTDAYGKSLFIEEIKGNILYSTKVIPETVGQYINRIDRQGNKIFEGDIFVDQTVTWCDETSSFYLKDKYNSDYNESLKELHFMEITGNIHDKQ